MILYFGIHYLIKINYWSSFWCLSIGLSNCFASKASYLGATNALRNYNAASRPYSLKFSGQCAAATAI